MGREGGSLAAAGLISGGEHITLRQARRRLYAMRRSTGGKQASKKIGGFFFFFFFFFYIIYSLLRYKKSHGALAMAKTKPETQSELTKEKIRNISLQLGSVPVPGPHTGTKLKQVNQMKPSLNQRTA